MDKKAKKYGILTIESEGMGKWNVSLPGKEKMSLNSKGEVEILSLFRITFEVKVVGYTLSAAELDGERYLIVKEGNLFSVRGFNLIGVYPGDTIAQILDGELYIDFPPMARYRIEGEEVRMIH